MTHFNFLIALNRTGAHSEATHEQKGIWFDLVNYCCQQENGGRIHCADKWTDRQWIRNVGVELVQIQGVSPLWKMNDFGTLIVMAYPHEHEKAAQAKRAAANATNKARWGYSRKRKKSLSDTVSDTVSESLPAAQREEKVRKEKGHHSANGNSVVYPEFSA